MADAAARVARLGEEIRTVADRHRNDIAAAGTTLLDVREVVRTTGTEVTQLAEQSTAIDDFVDLIKRTSSQTNLLALHAPIQAAHPGVRPRLECGESDGGGGATGSIDTTNGSGRRGPASGGREITRRGARLPDLAPRLFPGCFLRGGFLHRHRLPFLQTLLNLG